MVAVLGLIALLEAQAVRVATPVSPCPADLAHPVVALSVAVDPRDANTAFLVGNQTLYQTEHSDCLTRRDAGLEPIPPFFRSTHPLTVTLDPQQPDTVYLGTEQGVFKSIDGGKAWTRRNVGIPFVLNEADVFPIAVDPHRSAVVFVGGYGGIYKTVNGGDSWSRASNGVADPVHNDPRPFAFAFDPRNTDIVYVANYRLFKTTNGGDLWEPMDHLLPGPSTAVAVDWASPDIVYVGTTDGLFLSPDGGFTWQQMGLSGRTVQTLQQDPISPTTILAGTDVGAYRTDDGGSSWLPLVGPFQGSSIFSIAIARTDPAVIYVAGPEAGIWRSQDGGATWRALQVPRRSTREIGRGHAP